MPVDDVTLAKLPDHIRALLSPSTYEHPAQNVELIQTLISYVLLAGNYAYKLRKAVDLGFVDFTDLDQRKRDCMEEVRLNSRTCSSLYLGVLSVSRDGQRYRLGGAGEIVDYAVRMRRLPPESLMSNLLNTGELSFDMIGRLVWKLVRFHAASEGGRRVRQIGGYQTQVDLWASNLHQVLPYAGRTVSRAQFDAIRSYADAFLDGERTLLKRREDEGRVRDCHGDLRADAICFDSGSADGVCIFDCLEFSERLRYSDTGLDICFLAMDVERRGFRDVADTLLSLYTAATGDKTLPLVSSFFRCYRALVRAKVASMILEEQEVPAEQRSAAEAEARLHFELAASYARPNSGPRVVLVMGLTGSGKSLLAGALAHRIGAALLSTDIVRKELAGALPSRRRPVAVGAGLYTPAMSQRVYAEMTRQAQAFLAEGRAVVVDGAYLTSGLRAPVIELGRGRGLPLLVVECLAPDEVVHGRQERRGSEPWAASDATWDVYLSQKQQYQPPDEVPRAEHLRLDTTNGLAGELELVLEALAGGDGPA